MPRIETKRFGPRKIELIHGLKRFQSMAERASLPPELIQSTWQSMLAKIGQSRPIVERRLAGLSAEDELALILLLLGNAEQVTPLDQRQGVSSEKYSVPDFLVTVKVPEDMIAGEKLLQRFFIEVKTNRRGEDAIHVPIDSFNRLLNFSHLYGLPLYFSIRMKTKAFNNWFLISAVDLVRISKRGREAPRGRMEDCLSANFLDLLSADLSGIWFSNFTVVAPSGLQLHTSYSKTGKGPAYDEKFGRLVKLEAKSNVGRLVIQFTEGQPFDDLLTEQVLSRLPYEKTAIKELSDGVEVIRRCKNDCWAPFYQLVLSTYLDVRPKFEEYISKIPSKNPTITYLVESFSQFDQNLAAGIRNAIWRLYNERLILPIRMMPKKIPENLITQ